MGLAFIQIAPLLGYKASMFNLVFENNIHSVHLWRSLGFREIGRVPNVGYLKKRKEITESTKIEVEEEFVDALMFYYDFT
jgi:L-amino acid N-acyltransferase YncA